MKVSVIVPVYDDPEGLARCLESLARVADEDFEVVVVDDGSPRSHEPVCAAFGARFVRLRDNVGPGAARNEGARRGGGEILAFTDSDCTVPTDWLLKIREALRQEDVVAVAGTFDRSIGDNFICRQRLLEARFYHVKERRLVNSFTTSNFAIKAKVFWEAGGFPPLWVGEDLLFGYKLKRLGYGVLWLYELAVAQAFRPSRWAYFRQQLQWVSNILWLTLYYPELQGMAWSVERTGLFWQLGLQALLIGLLPFARPTVPWATIFLAGVGGLGVLNWPFLRFARRHESTLFAAQLFASTILLRNTAWMVGAARVFLRSPWRTLSRVRFLLAGAEARAAGTEAGEALPYLGNELAPEARRLRG